MDRLRRRAMFPSPGSVIAARIGIRVPTRQPAVVGVDRGLEAQRARQSADFTAWDANLADLDVPGPGQR